MDLESDRLSELRRYHILDTPPDAAFDRITTLAAQCFDVPISLISLVDENRIWFKAKHGLGVEEIPRVPGLCSNVIQSDDVYVVNDAESDPRTKDNPLVCGPLGLRFYAAAPLVTADGYRLGTVNLIDTKPRNLSTTHQGLLKVLAGVVIDQLEVRMAARQTISSLSKLLSRTQRPQEIMEMLTVCAWTKRIKVGESWITFEEFISNELGLKITHGMAPDASASFISALRSSSAKDPKGSAAPQ